MRGWLVSARAAAIRLASGARPLRILQWIAGRHQPPDTVELEALEREQSCREMGLMRRIEGSAEQADPHAGRVRGE